MPTECSATLFEFARVEGRSVVGAFDGGKITSDAGALLLAATDRAVGLIDRFAGCFTDSRSPELVEYLTREDDALCADGQASNAQCLRRPGVAGMTEVVGSGGGVEDALRIGAGSNTVWRRFCIRGQIVP